MDWKFAIEKNREALMRVVIAFMRSIGLINCYVPIRLPFLQYRFALRFMVVAEAAVRRLIVMAAYELELRGIKVRITPVMAFGQRHATAFPNPRNFAPSFNLIEPLASFHDDAPDYNTFGEAFDHDGTTSLRAPVLVAAICRRLLALRIALDSIEKQARRLSRWHAKRDLARKKGQPQRLWPLRPGSPPGFRKKQSEEIEKVLGDCHYFARLARQRPDSS